MYVILPDVFLLPDGPDPSCAFDACLLHQIIPDHAPSQNSAWDPNASGKSNEEVNRLLTLGLFIFMGKSPLLSPDTRAVLKSVIGSLELVNQSTDQFAGKEAI